MDARSSAVTCAVSEGNSARISSNGTTRVVGIGAVSVRTQRRMIGPLLWPAVSSQFAIPGSSIAQHDAHQAVGIDRGLVPVQARLVAPVVDRLPPRVADREAPVKPLRRLDFDDERLVRAAAPNEPITGRFSAAAPMSVPSIGGRKPFGGAAAPNCRKNSRLSSTKSPSATSCRATATSGSTGRARGSARRRRAARCDSDDATSVSQS